MTAQTAPRRALLLLLPLLLAATSLCAQHPEPKPQPDSLPRIYLREQDSEPFYERIGLAYGLLFRYESLVGRLRDTPVGRDSLLGKAHDRYNNLYAGALERMRAFSRMLNIQSEMRNVERRIDSAVVALVNTKRDSLPELLDELYSSLAFNRQDESVQTFGNCFDPNYIHNPLREVEDSLVYVRDFGPTEAIQASVSLTLPASFDAVNEEGVPGAGFTILALIKSCGGGGEFFVSISARPLAGPLPTADQMREVLQSDEVRKKAQDAAAQANRKALTFEFYQHPRGPIGVSSRVLIYEKDQLLNVAETRSLLMPGYNVVIGYGVRGDGTQSQAELERRLAHWQPLGEFMLERAEIRVGE